MGNRKGYWEKIADHVAAVVRDREIADVLHFTKLQNLPGIFEHGLLSRAMLQYADYDVFASDEDRLDGKDEAISVSISCYYVKMFQAKRFRSNGATWVILVLDPSVLWNHHCLFYRNGAATNDTKHEQGNRYGGFALQRLFEDYSEAMIRHGTGFREAHGLPVGWPTFPDSEVQVMDPIHPKYIRGVWAETTHDSDLVHKVIAPFGRDDCKVIARPFEPRIGRMPYFWG